MTALAHLTPEEARTDFPDWKSVILEHQKPSLHRALWQIVNTIGSYAVLWAIMWWTMQISWWLTLPIAVLAGGLYIRAFIIFHDCGHSSFFKSKQANDIVGFLAGVLTFTPYFHWKRQHSLHHGTSGDLDRRGAGDIWTMTVEEYLQASRWERFFYQIARNPVFLFVISPVLLFAVRQRFASPNANARERTSVLRMNLAIVPMIAAFCWIYGWQHYLIIQLVIMAVAGSGGVWLFYVQHQFEETYWERAEDWDHTAAALQGSSFYKLPKVFQWFSGNIGFHHIHHLSSRIPNYHLERCHNSHPLFRAVKPLTFIPSLKSLTFRLWDEPNRRLVGYDYLRTIKRK